MLTDNARKFQRLINPNYDITLQLVHTNCAATSDLECAITLKNSFYSSFILSSDAIPAYTLDYNYQPMDPILVLLSGIAKQIE